MNMLKMLVRVPMLAILLIAAASGEAAQLSTDARTAIPHDVQQLIVIDYKAMQNSAAATNLRERLMPAELKPFDEALRKSGLNENHDVEQLAFALFRTKDSGDTLTTSCMRKRSKTQRTSRNEADIGEDLNRREPLRPRPSVRRI
jgi:hypothetical protein